MFMKTNWIGDSGALCHIMNCDTGLFDVTDINKLIQGSSRSMLAIKKGMHFTNVGKVDITEWVYALWPGSFAPRPV